MIISGESSMLRIWTLPCKDRWTFSAFSDNYTIFSDIIFL